MIYLSPQAKIKDGNSTRWGSIFTPRSGRGRNPQGRVWVADNGAYTGNFSPLVFFAWLETMQPHRGLCKFVTCPDSVGNAIETLARYRWYAWKIKALGFPVGFVAQDGQESLLFPPEYDALFIG